MIYAMGYFLDRTGFAVGCVGMLAGGGMLAYGTLVNHAMNQTFGLSAAGVFAIFAVFCGRCFCLPDEWFAARNRRFQAWTSRHPVLWGTLVVGGILSLVWKVVRALAGHGVR